MVFCLTGTGTHTVRDVKIRFNRFSRQQNQTNTPRIVPAAAVLTDMETIHLPCLMELIFLKKFINVFLLVKSDNEKCFRAMGSSFFPHHRKRRTCHRMRNEISRLQVILRTEYLQISFWLLSVLFSEFCSAFVSC